MRFILLGVGGKITIQLTISLDKLNRNKAPRLPNLSTVPVWCWAAVAENAKNCNICGERVLASVWFERVLVGSGRLGSDPGAVIPVGNPCSRNQTRAYPGNCPSSLSARRPSGSGEWRQTGPVRRRPLVLATKWPPGWEVLGSANAKCRKARQIGRWTRPLGDPFRRPLCRNGNSLARAQDFLHAVRTETRSRVSTVGRVYRIYWPDGPEESALGRRCQAAYGCRSELSLTPRGGRTGVCALCAPPNALPRQPCAQSVERLTGNAITAAANN